jgi:hypothetical protein
VQYYPFVVVYHLIVWMAVYLPLASYYGTIKSKLAEFPKPLPYSPLNEVCLEEDGYVEALLHIRNPFYNHFWAIFIFKFWTHFDLKTTDINLLCITENRLQGN